ncbi:uncharacterized protein LOC119979845 [Tripterygium wilfordii]|uniref:uncharacterized protein LOC119979845 n=1 Tax=Tripterygium wilfordii TaxID=458696 RepID=UPI0018F8493F|nr:uncharacterized protein LOC119979845 [Tripterygium wilfordii]
MKLNDIVNTSFTLCEAIESSKVVRKIPRSLPEIFTMKVVAIEESKDINKIKVEEFIGSLQTFEASFLKPKKSKSFKKFMKNRNSKDFKKEESSSSKSKRKSKDPKSTQCFECKGFGHFAQEYANRKKKPKAYQTTWSDDTEEESDVELEEENDTPVGFPVTLSDQRSETSLEEDDSVVDICELQGAYEDIIEDCIKAKKERHTTIKEKGLLVHLQNILDMQKTSKETILEQEKRKCNIPNVVNAKNGRAPLQLRYENFYRFGSIAQPFHPQSFYEKNFTKSSESRSMFVHISLAAFKTNSWYLDSSCLRHISGNKSFVTSFESFDGGKVTFGDGSQAKVKGKGMIRAFDECILNNVLYVKGLKANLISISHLCDSKYSTLFTKRFCRIYNDKHTCILKAKRSSDNYYTISIEAGFSCKSSIVSTSDRLWHERLGHLNYQDLKKLSNKEVV